MTAYKRHGVYAADLTPGDVYEHTPGRTIYAAENSIYCGLTLNSNSGHLDAFRASSTEFGRPLMNALFVLSVVVGLSVSEIGEGTAIANLSFGEVRFPVPVFDGDTIYSVTTVVSVRVSKSRVNAAVVEFEHRGLNQDGVTVCVGRRTGLMHYSDPRGNGHSAS